MLNYEMNNNGDLGEEFAKKTLCELFNLLDEGNDDMNLLMQMSFNKICKDDLNDDDKDNFIIGLKSFVKTILESIESIDLNDDLSDE